MSEALWVIMPVLGAEDLTDTAIADVLAQTIPVKLLIVNQGVETAFRERLERIAEQYPDRIFLWSHVPPLPSLSASWNRALRFVWETGGTEALVVNNDVRLHPRTIHLLQYAKSYATQGTDAPYFVTAVGVTEAQFDSQKDWAVMARDLFINAEPVGDSLQKGGPDFSCFLISKEGHWKYPFDEKFIPAYAEDCDMHRRYMLSGDGEKIFSINLPYLHYASGTLKSLDPDARRHLEQQLGQSRAYYARKWGGPVNGERWTIPFDASTDQAGVTNPELQRAIQATI